MTEFDILSAESAAETQDTSSGQTDATQDEATTPLFCAPLLDPIRTSD